MCYIKIYLFILHFEGIHAWFLALWSLGGGLETPGVFGPHFENHCPRFLSLKTDLGVQ